MREAAAAAIANFFIKHFPASSLQAKILKQAALFGAAILFVWLLSLTYGLDLSPGFF